MVSQNLRWGRRLCEPYWAMGRHLPTNIPAYAHLSFHFVLLAGNQASAINKQASKSVPIESILTFSQSFYKRTYLDSHLVCPLLGAIIIGLQF